jgi:hypothetical protein
MKRLSLCENASAARESVRKVVAPASGRHVRLTFFAMLFLGIAAVCSAAVKPQYGGTLKVAVDLMENIDREQIFDASGENLLSLYGLPFTVTGNTLVTDFNGVDPTALLEVEQSVAKLQDANNRCHWILDYPFFTHQHPTSVEFQNGNLTVQSAEPDYLKIAAASACLMPEHFRILNPFRRTQFAFEANPNCVQGRPFINSVIPVSVDPANPYLSFKLGDVDVIEVPEDRFAQISKDPDLVLLNGPRIYVYLRTTHLSPQQATALASTLNLSEMTKAALNDHAENLLPATADPDASTLAGVTVHVTIPGDEPFQLLGERMIVQWNRAGIATSTESPTDESPGVELIVKQINEADFDAFRYLLMRMDRSGHGGGAGAWFEEWDEQEADGTLIPLLIYTARIAARKNIQNLKILPDGSPDFGDCWIQAP